MVCELCKELFKELCYLEGKKNPVLCQIYEDYVTGEVDGELPLDYVISIVGEERVEEIGARILERFKNQD